LLPHPGIKLIDLSVASEEKYDFVVLTYWATIFMAPYVQAKTYTYFVQSIESRFVQSDRLLARHCIESTYSLPFGYICEASWIENYLARVHQRAACLVRNGIDKDSFCIDGPALAPRLTTGRRILVEGSVDIWFKNVSQSIRCARQGGAAEVWLLTPTPVSSVDGVDRLFSAVAMSMVPEIYRACDLILKLSLVEGMFLPPLEMFHCGGTCVVFDVTGHEEYIAHGLNGLVARTGEYDEVIHYLRILTDNEDALQTLKNGAVETAKRWSTWEESSARFSVALDEAESVPTISQAQLKPFVEQLSSFWAHAE
jgi:glycosyltransferase involved in cell wall biosynthesis